MNNETALIPQTEEPIALERPMQTPEEAVAFAQRCAALAMKAIKPVKIKNKDYLTFESWQVLGRFYNYTSGTEWTKKVKDDNGTEVYIARAVVKNQQGIVVSSAESECSRSEKRWADADDYAIRSMAQTRACAKSLRNALAWVAVLAGFEPTPAEEIPVNDNEPPFESTPRPVAQDVTYTPIEPTPAPAVNAGAIEWHRLTCKQCGKVFNSRKQYDTCYSCSGAGTRS